MKSYIPNNIKQVLKPIVSFVNTSLNAGTKHTCPICLYSSNSFAYVGFDFPVLKTKHIIGAGRRQARCYSCRSIDRERLVYTYLKYEEKIFADNSKSILHFAPEETISTSFFDYNFKDYVCGDLFTEGYEYPPHVQNMNVLNIPYPDDYFDLVICNHILEHVEQDIDAMKEIRRVLKPGGKAILQVPIAKYIHKTYEDPTITSRADRERYFGQYDHVRIYGQDYVERIASSGLKVNRINISYKYPDFGLNKEEDLFIGIK
ncbi:MAG: class I SAM-dependent methyltransferase [Flavobacteriaceae bacterium]|nr:class I SAM-dependent methyltransferase [Flavobacteriaceae bacterium]